MHKALNIGIAAVAAFCSFTIPLPTQAAEPSAKCLSGKLLQAGKYAGCRMKMDSRAVAKGVEADYYRCESRFSDEWDAIEARAAGACASTGDEAAVKAAISTCVGDVAAGLKPSIQAPRPEVRCSKRKLKAAGKYVACRMKMDSRAAAKGVAPDYTRCESKFSARWRKTETKSAGACPTSGDEAAVEAAITMCMDNVAAGLTSSASSACPGALVDGACWFLSENQSDCIERCAEAGLRYDQATRMYAGSDGTDANCEKILDALGAPGDPFVLNSTDCSNVPNGMGCFHDLFYHLRVRCSIVPTDATSFFPDAQRVCACAP